MVTSYEVISLDHLAEHMICLSTASSFWFSLNSSYDHEFHLSKQLGITPQDYEFLLVAADLALFHKRYGFSIKPMKWKVFLEGHRFTTINCDRTFEVDEKKVDLNALMKGKPPKHRMKVNFIRIGVLHANSPRKIEMQKDSDGRMIVTPSRLNGLRLQQSSFRRLIKPILWNYILDNNVDEDHKDEDDGEDDEDDSDVDSEENATSSPTTSNKKRKYNAVQGIITPGEDENMKAYSNMAKSYPYLSRALGGEDGFDPTNPSVKRSMRELLKELNELLSTEYQLDVNGISNNKISYVRVPRSQRDRSFLNSKEWVDTAIEIAGSKQSTYESAKRITNHIIRYYRDSFLAACEIQRVPISKPMSATKFQAMLRAGGVSGTGERELKKHLSAHLGKGFCPTRRSVDMLAEGHCNLECSRIHNRGLPCTLGQCQ